MAGYTLPPLPYAYNALEPIIDAKIKYAVEKPSIIINRIK